MINDISQLTAVLDEHGIGYPTIREEAWLEVTSFKFGVRSQSHPMNNIGPVSKDFLDVRPHTGVEIPAASQPQAESRKTTGAKIDKL